MPDYSVEDVIRRLPLLIPHSPGLMKENRGKTQKKLRNAYDLEHVLEYFNYKRHKELLAFYSAQDTET